MVKPHHVFEDVKRRSRTRDLADHVRFYWVAITREDDGGDRNQFRQLLCESAGDYPLLPVVIRVAGFEDPNAVMNDLAAVVENCKSDLRAAENRERIAQRGFVDFVLISRRELALAVMSSPLMLPNWFPISPGEEVIARIDDLTWSAGVVLSAPEARVGEIKRLLCELDRVLLNRVREVGRENHRLVRGLLDTISHGRKEAASLEDFVSKAQVTLNRVENPREYRPSSRSGTVVGHLWSLTARKHPDGLGKVAGTLAQALGVRDQEIEEQRESIMAVRNLPTPVRHPFDSV